MRKEHESDFDARCADEIALLMRLINTPSFSGEEDLTAAELERWLQSKGIVYQRQKNNLWAKNRHFDLAKPTLLLNSHHDTVRPNGAYTRDPFSPEIEGDRLFGLGSNDAGASVVCLLHAFGHFYTIPDLTHNVIIAITAEEENSGRNGIEALLPNLPPIDLAIVGEPTEMQLAIAERGLLVVDACARGVAGHVANDQAVNPIVIAMKDLQRIEQHPFTESSDVLGPVKFSVTQIYAGTQHNVVPECCEFVIDVRLNELYSGQSVFRWLNDALQSDVSARSFRLKPSSIDPHHPIVTAARQLGLSTFGSPTLSDQSLLPFPSVKIGPGKSKRSHSSNEYVRISEIVEGCHLYKSLIKNYLNETVG